jgi:hypothetical protein
MPNSLEEKIDRLIEQNVTIIHLLERIEVQTQGDYERRLEGLESLHKKKSERYKGDRYGRHEV